MRLSRLIQILRGGVNGRRLGDERGAMIIEFAVAASVYLSLYFGILELCMALYSYNFVSEAAREGTRYAAVRGSQSCVVSSSFPDCNLLPTNITSSTSNPVLTYINSQHYPALNSNNLSAAVTWWEPIQDANGHTSWTTACTGAKDGSGIPCNVKGNMVRVVVNYNFPLYIPFWKNASVPVTSTSQMMINE